MTERGSGARDESVSTAEPTSRIESSSQAPERSMATRLVDLCREPLLHFLILGALLFGLQSYRQRTVAPSTQRITVSAGRIEHLAALFTRTWQRPPSSQELAGLVDDYVREEVAYREGLRLGLDQDDTIIRRRIRQKLDFFAEDLVNQIEPTDEQLTAFLSANVDAYRVDPRLTFRHIFFDPARHGAELELEIKTLRDALQADLSKDATELGDRTLLEHQYRTMSQREVASQFGEEFATAIAALEPARWLGPIPSAYGVHLVCVDEREAGRARPLAEVREAVRRDWEHQQRKVLAEEFYRSLVKKYEVAIEWPSAAAEQTTTSEPAAKPGPASKTEPAREPTASKDE